MRRRLMTTAAVLAIGLVATPFAVQAQQIKGRPSVTSGDTLSIGRDTVRLSGIDAPEVDQYCENEFGRPYQCGIQAMDALRELVGRNDVVCVKEGADEDGRMVGTCYSGDMNLNTRMVRTGWAVALPEERPDYAPLEKMAKSEKVGIWGLKFEHPAEWRKQNQ
ncbi:thermonuclease family protein [Thalassobaculum sp. OXR-137]|uniref:thermonuclease family protein n=1 Tax=Thalassobaculum sp. OXR-137 TaxID=3100173 RepID=UPI002AC8F826|nr:thermonuclease family protein [Thalassobaculum sp. OXR-137]WPZ34372.1 thermonuclease family protein [Thalassobaculum sp. OXR-137]